MNHCIWQLFQRSFCCFYVSPSLSTYAKPIAMTPQRRFGRTSLEKWKICHAHEDILDHPTEPGIIPMSEHVSECISVGITSSVGMENDLESLFEADIASTPPPLISSYFSPRSYALLSFHSLPVSSLPPVPGSSSINIFDLAKSLSNTHRSLNQYLATQKKQSSLDSWPQPRSS